MNLVIDAGNTLVKVAIFQVNSLVKVYRFEKENFLEKISEILKEFPEVKHAIVCSVTNFSQMYIQTLSVFCKVHVLSSSSKIPFINQYKTPETLGVDRIGLITAAYFEYSKKNTLVIDAGTCITYDFITEHGAYLGGAISPGLQMRFKSLHTFTAKLPLITSDKFVNYLGNNTETCIASGVVNGVCAEIIEILRQYSSDFPDLTVILTGGDHQILSKRLKNGIFANSNFLLLGLNYLLELNKH
ncbi:type III pantothenate kinase [Zhouia sp. PK063]|uniref:type III pantothenate kinase n=1 Tax=Zhouia sp. PK063 TaxID=3373602 RepID=UPI0037B8A3F4